jgi:hypothetical protein
MDLVRFQVDATSDDASFVNHEFLRGTEGDDLLAYANPKSRKITRRSFGPFEIDSPKAGELLGRRDVAPQIIEIASERAIDPVV